MIAMITIGIILLASLMLQLKQPRSKEKQLAALLPISKIEGDCIISKAGDITFCFELTLPEIFSLATEEYEALHHVWGRAIRVLPTGTVIHKQDWYLQDEYKADFEGNDEKTFLGRSAERFFHGRPILTHKSYLFITRKATGRKPSNSAISNLLRPAMFPAEVVKGQALFEFQDRVGQFERLLSEGGFIQPRRMNAAELSGDSQKAGLLERYCFLLSETDAPVMEDITFKPEWKIGDKYCQMYTLADVEDLPGMCGPRITYDKYSTDRTKFAIGFAAPCGLLLPCNHIYNQVLVLEDPQKTMKKLETKRRRLQSLSAYSRENAISRDATNDFLNEAISQSRLPVRAHYNLIAWTADRHQLKELRNQASSSLAQLDANPREEIKGAPQLYWSSLPGNSADIPDNELFDTFLEQASCFFTQETCYRDSPSPVGIRLVDRQTGAPVHFDLSDWGVKTGLLSNRNKFIVGASGSGKSLLCNALIKSYLEQGSHAVIIDVGNSYQGLCQLMGGYYFSYTEENPIKFNPFFISDGDVLDTERRESIKTLLIALWKRENESYKQSEYVALSNALVGYFEKLAAEPSLFPCFNTFYEYLQGEFMDTLRRQNVKEKEFDVDNFLYVMQPYYKGGEFDFLLNAEENLDLLKTPLIIFELDNIKEHPVLLSVTTLIVMQLFISKMRKLKGVRKIIVIEEAWKAIATSGMANFIKYLYKTVRKYFGEAWCVSQEIGDLINSPIIRDAIINNADCKILLDMKKFVNKFDAIQAAMGMSDKGKMMVLSLNRANDSKRKYREFYVDFSGQYMKVFGYEPSPYEYYCFTTEEREKLLVQQYTAAHNGDMRLGIKALVADLEAQKN
ncbi:TraG family conjugative transposon ATPase [Chitinophaga arvensicola]|uniref:Bacteroides conjugation system ATPase, TraG family n=1 Tax=Chitinophaga arvensicola TaxID=29529 RepID=A0A1I0PNL0_9BACT|nr:TraG family conjugative transposon ATPase [Chitinophaga arvensicola]SEW16004.1 Bacteroides conjugation system ATPase, TraG family [Chitinophaga arvensicola]